MKIFNIQRYQNGNIIRLSVLDYTNNKVYNYQPKSMISAKTGVFVGYITSTVIDGIVVTSREVREQNG